MRAPFGLVLALVGVAAAGCEKSTTTAPTLTAQCAATPSAGQAPLTVVFTLSVAGADGAFTIAVSYGDGTQGTDPDRPHVYPAPGAYSASFTVTSASQSARCSTPIAVAAPPTPAPPAPPADQPPQPFYKTDPPASGSKITGTAPLTVNFNMCRSVDDRDTLYYRMDLDGDGAFEFHGATGSDCRHEVTYAVGTHLATICVTDVDCSTWPLCDGLPPLHPFQCRTYTVVATP
jgi:PKD repeat protein